MSVSGAYARVLAAEQDYQIKQMYGQYGISNFTWGVDPGPQKPKEISDMNWKIEGNNGTVKQSTEGELYLNLTGNITREAWKSLKLKIDELFDCSEEAAEE